ncbi:hypothetical protein MFRU_006g02510 [Monilinia fructicola]|nr:hypothetical protein MFRU_006g02510 [Monilinia fructicola]
MNTSIVRNYGTRASTRTKLAWLPAESNSYFPPKRYLGKHDAGHGELGPAFDEVLRCGASGKLGGFPSATPLHA